MSSSLYLPVWIDVLVELHKAPDYKRYCQKMGREVNISMNHIRAVVRRLAEKNLVEIVSTKKIKRIIVTEKGKRIAVAVQSIKSELK